ncbi:hypothetical protein B0A48_04696 [Cryoendolithus antarcticus]|uniref:Uncharacterized protein n=1 Tax=Cryoendolithus antarcticus TaxID=1507870 RepID=A0A1V8TDH9_9PEZI|nr:hypothetical protein B0A48_04696 [Cryoendolithus antarcticus]
MSLARLQARQANKGQPAQHPAPIHQAGQGRPDRTSFTIFRQPPQEDTLALPAVGATSHTAPASRVAPAAPTQSTPPVDPSYRRKAGEPPFVRSRDETNMRWAPRDNAAQKTDQRRPQPGTYWMPYDWTNSLKHGTFMETISAFIRAEKEDHKVMRDRDPDGYGDAILRHCRRMLASSNADLLRIISSGNLAREMWLKNKKIHSYILGLTKRSRHTPVIYKMEFVREYDNVAATPNQLRQIMAIAEQFNLPPDQQGDEIKAAKAKWERKHTKTEYYTENGRKKTRQVKDTLREAELASMLAAMKARLDDIPISMQNLPEEMPMGEVGYAKKGETRMEQHMKQSSSNKLMVLFFYVAQQIFKGRDTLIIRGNVIYCIWDENQASLAEAFFSVIASAYTKTGHGFSYTPAGVTVTSIFKTKWAWNLLGREATYTSRLIERMEADNHKTMVWARSRGVEDGGDQDELTEAELAARVADLEFLRDLERKLLGSTLFTNQVYSYLRRVVHDVEKSEAAGIASDAPLPMSETSSTSKPSSEPSSEKDSDEEMHDDASAADMSDLPFFGSDDLVYRQNDDARQMGLVYNRFVDPPTSHNAFVVAGALQSGSDDLAAGRDDWGVMPSTTRADGQSGVTFPNISSAGAQRGMSRPLLSRKSGKAPVASVPSGAARTPAAPVPRAFDNDENWDQVQLRQVMDESESTSKGGWLPVEMQQAMAESKAAADAANRILQRNAGGQGSSLRPFAGMLSQLSLPSRGQSQPSAIKGMQSTMPSSPPPLYRSQPETGSELSNLDPEDQRLVDQRQALHAANRRAHDDSTLRDHEIADDTAQEDDFDDTMEDVGA